MKSFTPQEGATLGFIQITKTKKKALHWLKQLSGVARETGEKIIKKRFGNL
jgi:hypothetical protein